jgi:hypothetical protein
MLRAAANGLDRRPHITVRGHQVPPRGQKLVRLDASSVVDFARASQHAIVQRLGPDHVAVAFDHRVGAAQFNRFFRIKGRVDAPENYPGAAFAGDFAHLVAAQGISRVDPDPHHIAGI